MKTKVLFGLLLPTIIFTYSCSSKEGKEKSVEIKDETAHEINDTIIEETKINLNHDYNDIALFLAGKSIPENSNLYKFSTDSTYARYSKKIEIKFRKYSEKQLSKIFSWSEKELAPINLNSKEILYPFSGPDIIHALTLFPKAENFYLYGLESVGAIPNINLLGKDSTARLFSSLNNAISDNLFLSFFLTNEMKKDLNSTYIKGTIPILMFFLSRMDYHVQAIKPIEISDEGKIIYTETKSAMNLNNYNKAVEITVVDIPANSLKRIYYFSIDLSDPAFNKNLGMQNFLNSRNTPLTTLVKSGSYCLHGAKYKTIRELILAKSKYLLQDDTGIPYFILDSTNWDIKLYGSYTRPVKVFAGQYQDDFKKAMDEKAMPVDFRFGYTNLANILYGEKN